MGAQDLAYRHAGGACVKLGATRLDHDEFDRADKNAKNDNGYNRLTRILAAEISLPSSMLL
jgi:hypothetical protein